MQGYRFRTHGIPFFKKQGSWEIDIYRGPSPIELASHPGARNPVLTANDVSDARAYFVADPFMVRDNGIWYMFFEVMNRSSQRGEIALATSMDGRRWRYAQRVLVEPFHLSFPYVFGCHGEYYMVPESNEAGAVRLYRASRFPTEWQVVAELCSGEPFVDPCPFLFEGRWWMFVANPANDCLRLFSSDTLVSGWSEHPRSPVVVGDPSKARPAGRVVLDDGRLIRYAQDCGRAYGERVRAFAVERLTATEYAESLLSQAPLRRSGRKQGRRSHHVDPHLTEDGTWIACGDSFRNGPVFGWRY